MEERTKGRVLSLYDEYIDTLKHASELNLNVESFNQNNHVQNWKTMESFLDVSVNPAHKSVVDGILQNMLGRKIGFGEIRDIRTFIYYPDFNVLTYVDNPANVYKNNSSIEKTILITPAYELNLVMEENALNKRRAVVLRVKRLQISSSVNIFSCRCDNVEAFALRSVLNDLVKQFEETFHEYPNENDLILLKNGAIKYIFEHVKLARENSLDCLYEEDAYCSYDYEASKRNIMSKYGVSFADNYESVSKINSPWIYRGLEYFDNRMSMKSNGNTKVIPLVYQRIKK